MSNAHRSDKFLIQNGKLDATITVNICNHPLVPVIIQYIKHMFKEFWNKFKEFSTHFLTHFSVLFLHVYGCNFAQCQHVQISYSSLLVVNYQQSEIFVPWLVQYGMRKANQGSQSSFNTITVQHFVITILINNTMFIMTTNIAIIITLIYNYYYHHHHNYSLPLFTEFW